MSKVKSTLTSPERSDTSQAANVPSHGVYVVEGEGDDAYWTRVGAAWLHRDGQGFNVALWGADIGRAQNHAKETNEERSLGWSDTQGPSSPERRYSSHVARPRALMVNLSGLLGALSSRPNLTNGRIELAPITSLSSGA